MIARVATTFVGIVLILYGVIAAVSPLPLGVVLIAVGFIMIAGANPAARPLIRRLAHGKPRSTKQQPMFSATRNMRPTCLT